MNLPRLPYIITGCASVSILAIPWCLGPYLIATEEVGWKSYVIVAIAFYTSVILLMAFLISRANQDSEG